jgi:hypothetical protein
MHVVAVLFIQSGRELTDLTVLLRMMLAYSSCQAFDRSILEKFAIASDRELYSTWRRGTFLDILHPWDGPA